MPELQPLEAAWNRMFGPGQLEAPNPGEVLMGLFDAYDRMHQIVHKVKPEKSGDEIIRVSDYRDNPRGDIYIVAWERQPYALTLSRPGSLPGDQVRLQYIPDSHERLSPKKTQWLGELIEMTTTFGEIEAMIGDKAVVVAVDVV